MRFANHARRLLMLTLAALVLNGTPVLAEGDAVDRLDQATRATPNAVDTALVFTNLTGTSTRVSMVAYDSAGRRIGAKEIAVPGNGVEYVLASEIGAMTDTRRFIGKVVSRAPGRLTSTAVLIGGGLTDLPTIVQSGRSLVGPSETQAYTSMTFPVVATY